MNNDTLILVALANELEGFIHKIIPESINISNYSGALFTLKPEEKEGQFCGVLMYKQQV
ncbi:MAG: hypothetical protein ACI9D5_001475 [Candidatus Endobugula sp.]|jgi:hypothetical protein